MFGFGSLSHILVVLVLALILIGPKQLPEVARTLGRLLGELRRTSNMFQDQFNAQMREYDHNNIIKPSQDHQADPQLQSANYHQEPPADGHLEQQLELQLQSEVLSTESENSTQVQFEKSSDEKKS